MAITRYRPRNLMEELQRDFFDLGPWLKNGDQSLVATSDWVPKVDIKEEDQAFVVIADIPGVDPKDIDVSMENHILTVKGERQSEHTESGKNFSRVERSYGTFYRQFTLPDTAQGDKISAHSKNGVLTITIPKQEKSISRKIEIEQG